MSPVREITPRKKTIILETNGECAHDSLTTTFKNFCTCFQYYISRVIKGKVNCVSRVCGASIILEK